jgi:Predicted transcriptional regulators
MKNRLRALREQIGITQEELSRKSGVSRPTISAIESNQEYITTNITLEKIARAIDFKVSDIFFRD